MSEEETDDTKKLEMKENIAIALAKEIISHLQEEQKKLKTRQTAKMTDNNLSSAIKGISGLVKNNIINNFPANTEVSIEASADKKTSWLEETFPKLKLGVCKGEAVDLQVRDSQSGNVLLNMETELNGGNRHFKEDHDKLISHSEDALVSMMMGRSKSGKNIDKKLSKFGKASRALTGSMVYIETYLKSKDTYDKAEFHARVYEDGKEVWRNDFD